MSQGTSWEKREQGISGRKKHGGCRAQGKCEMLDKSMSTESIIKNTGNEVSKTQTLMWVTLILLFWGNEVMRSKSGIKQGRGTGQSNSKSKKNTRGEKKIIKTKYSW